MTKTTGIVAAVACCMAFVGSQSFAGILGTPPHPDAYAGWAGTVAFDNGAGMKGNVDYAVFTAAQFNANFSGLGYVPGDALVYTYQVINAADATDSISRLTVSISNPANTIGTFDIGDVDTSSEAFVGLNARYSFTAPNEIPVGMSSWGLAFSSPNIPMVDVGIVVDGGQSVTVNLPSPSDVPIPEPASLVLLALGTTIAGWRRNRSKSLD